MPYVTEGSVWSWEWITVGTIGSLEVSVEERSCGMVIWREEVFSGIGGVLREAIAGDTSRHRAVNCCGSGPCCVLVACSS